MKKIDSGFKALSLMLAPVLIITFFTITVSCYNKSKNKVVLRFFHWETASGLQILKYLVNRYMEKNPGIRIEIIQGVSTQYESKLLSMFAANQPPDIFEVSSIDIPLYVSKDQVLGLSEFIDKYSDLALTNFFPESMYFFQYDKNIIPGSGEIYGYPKDFSPTLTMYCNMRIFEECGVKPPEISLDENELAALLIKLTRRDKNKILTSIGYYPQSTYFFWWSIMCGNEPFSKDGTKLSIDNTNSFRGLRWLNSLKYTYRVVPNDADRESVGNKEAFIGQGKIAILPQGRYMYPNIKIYSKDKWDVIPSFHFKGNPPMNFIFPACGWAIAKKTRHPEESVKFMNYLAGTEGSIMAARLGYNIPPIKKIAMSKLFFNRLGEEGRINRFFIKELEISKQFPYSPYISKSELTRVIDQESQLMNRDKMPSDQDIKKTLKTIEKSVNDIINVKMKN